jgi:acetylornithine/N-succinyldiaminopimelate aminotransferase
MTLPHIFQCHCHTKSDIVKAEGVYLIDKAGKRYIDFESGIWCTVLGHGNARINRVIAAQLEKVIHLNIRLTNYLADETAASLLDHFHWDTGKVVFLSSGSEAMELGVVLAKRATGRNQVLTFSESYLSAFGQSGNFENDDTWIKLDILKCRNCTKKDCTIDCSLLAGIDFQAIAAFVLEPGSTHGRIIFPVLKLVTLLAERIKTAGGLVLIDEVTTGLGRTGKWFGYDYYRILPDIVVLGKALGNGYPVSAVLMDALVARILENNDFLYTQSHQNDPLGCAVAGEVIKILEETTLIKQSEILGDLLLEELTNALSNRPQVKEIRGRGLMVGVELHREGIVEEISAKMLNGGYFIGITPSANVLRFYPPLIIEEKMIEPMCTLLGEIIGDY